jgi:uncharacterized membrane protein
MSSVSELDVLARSSDLARKNGKELTFNTLKFFMRFLTLAEKDSESWFVAENSQSMADKVDMPTRTVAFCLKCLKEGGVLSCKRGKPTVWRVAVSVLATNETFS